MTAMRRSAALSCKDVVPSFTADWRAGATVVRPRSMWIGLFAALALTMAAVATAGGYARLSAPQTAAAADQF